MATTSGGLSRTFMLSRTTEIPRSPQDEAVFLVSTDSSLNAVTSTQTNYHDQVLSLSPCQLETRTMSRPTFESSLSYFADLANNIDLSHSSDTDQYQQPGDPQAWPSIDCSSLNCLDFDTRHLNFTDITRIKYWHVKETPDIMLRVFLVTPIILLGIIGNLTVLYSMARRKSFKTKPQNIFIANMAVADLLTSLVCPIFAFIKDIYQFYILGSFFCRLEGFVKITCFLVSSYSLIVLSTDWLLSVVKPCRTRITANQSWLALLLIWITSLLMALPLIFWRSLKERHWADLVEVWCCEDVRYSKYYWIVIAFFLIYLPTLSMTIVLALILAQMNKFEEKLRRSRATTADEPFAINMKHRRRLMQILFTYLLTSIICWAPLQCTIVYRHFRADPIASNWFFELTFCAQLSASLTAALNPIIFGFSAQPFRQCISRLSIRRLFDRIGFRGNHESNEMNMINHGKIRNANNRTGIMGSSRNFQNRSDNKNNFSKRSTSKITERQNGLSQIAVIRLNRTKDDPKATIRNSNSLDKSQPAQISPTVRFFKEHLSPLSRRYTMGPVTDRATNKRVSFHSTMSVQPGMTIEEGNNDHPSQLGGSRDNNAFDMTLSQNLDANDTVVQPARSKLVRHPPSNVSMDPINFEENLNNLGVGDNYETDLVEQTVGSGSFMQMGPREESDSTRDGHYVTRL